MATENIRIIYDVDAKELVASNKVLKNTVKANNLTQKEVAETTEKFKKQEKQLSKTNKKLGGLGDQLTSLGNRFQIAGKGAGDLAAGMFKTTRATSGASKALKFFRVALIATGIGAIVIALGSLIAAFSSTQSGIDKITKVLAPLKGGFQAIIGVVQDLAVNIFGQLKDRFTVASNSIQIGLGKMRVLWNLLTGDTEEALEINERNKVLIDESAAATERLSKKQKELSDILKGANERIKEGADTQREIVRLGIAIQRKQIDTTVAIAKARLEYEELRAVAQDQLKSDEERVAALNKAEEIQRFISGTAKEILDLQERKLVLSQTLNDTDREGEQELQDLRTLGIQADQEAQRKINSLVALRSGIEKRQILDKAKAADEELKGAEAKAAAEAAEDEVKRQAISELTIFKLEQEGLLVEAELERRKFLLEDLILTEEQRQLIIAESEAEIIKIKEDSGEAQKEIDGSVQTFKKDGAEQSLALVKNVFNEESLAAKGASIAQVGISTSKAAIAAFEQPPIGVGPVFGPIVAGLAIAFGTLQAAKIAGITPKFEKGGRIGGNLHSNGGTMIEAERDEFMMSRKATNKYGFDFMDKINNLELNDLTVKDTGTNVNIIDTKVIAEQLKNMPQNVINVDSEGFALHQRRGQYQMNQKIERYST